MVTKEIRHIEFHPGKPPARVDNRSLKMLSILKQPLPAIPAIFDLDKAYPKLIDTQVFANDNVGDCVIAQHAHQEYRFQYYQQNNQIKITDAEVLAQYYKETGGGDTGLDMLTSLNIWRQTGFLIGGKLYKIHAFATVNWKNHNNVMLGCMLFNGVAFGMQVPQSAMDQTNASEPWTVVSNDGGIQGGHAVYKFKWLKITNLNEIGPVCLTWGIEQQMTWAFWDKYVDEAYVIIDERNSWIPTTDTTDPLDIAVLEAYLAAIGLTPTQQMTITTTSLPVGTVGKKYSASLGVTGGTLPYSWSIYSGGSLPIGLSLINGVISGIPTRASKTKITFLVADSVGNQTGVILTLTVKKNCFLSNLWGGKQ
jgi:hypothetical protein